MRVDVPNIVATMECYKKIAIEKEEFGFAEFGIIDLDTLKKFYML